MAPVIPSQVQSPPRAEVLRSWTSDLSVGGKVRGGLDGRVRGGRRPSVALHSQVRRRSYLTWRMVLLCLCLALTDNLFSGWPLQAASGSIRRMSLQPSLSCVVPESLMMSGGGQAAVCPPSISAAAFPGQGGNSGNKGGFLLGRHSASAASMTFWKTASGAGGGKVNPNTSGGGMSTGAISGPGISTSAAGTPPNGSMNGSLNGMLSASAGGSLQLLADALSMPRIAQVRGSGRGLII